MEENEWSWFWRKMNSSYFQVYEYIHLYIVEYRCHCPPHHITHKPIIAQWMADWIQLTNAKPNQTFPYVCICKEKDWLYFLCYKGWEKWMMNLFSCSISIPASASH
jgi:hypothetical protein